MIDQADLSPLHVGKSDSKIEDRLNLFSEAPILDFKPPDYNQKHCNKQLDADLSLALDDLSAIVFENADKSQEIKPLKDELSEDEDDMNLADLHRNLMPNFIVNIGEK